MPAGASCVWRMRRYGGGLFVRLLMRAVDSPPINHYGTAPVGPASAMDVLISLAALVLDHRSGRQGTAVLINAVIHIPRY